MLSNNCFLMLPSPIPNCSSCATRNLCIFLCTIHANVPQTPAVLRKTAVSLRPNHIGTKRILPGSLGFKPPDRLRTGGPRLNGTGVNGNISALSWPFWPKYLPSKAILGEVLPTSGQMCANVKMLRDLSAMFSLWGGRGGGRGVGQANPHSIASEVLRCSMALVH